MKLKPRPEPPEVHARHPGGAWERVGWIMSVIVDDDMVALMCRKPLFVDQPLGIEVIMSNPDGVDVKVGDVEVHDCKVLNVHTQAMATGIALSVSLKGTRR